MIFRKQEYRTFPEIIDKALKLEGTEQEAFVEEYLQQGGPYALQNIGYWSGYYSADTALRIQEIFKTSHPIFGRRIPTADEALRRGMELGENAKRERRGA
jgi:hypothetical protein